MPFSHRIVVVFVSSRHPSDTPYKSRLYWRHISTIHLSFTELGSGVRAGGIRNVSSIDSDVRDRGFGYGRHPGLYRRKFYGPLSA